MMGQIKYMIQYKMIIRIKNKYIPNYIIGDLDSIREEVKNYYKLLSTKII